MRQRVVHYLLVSCLVGIWAFSAPATYAVPLGELGEQGDVVSLETDREVYGARDRILVMCRYTNPGQTRKRLKGIEDVPPFLVATIRVSLLPGAQDPPAYLAEMVPTVGFFGSEHDVDRNASRIVAYAEIPAGTLKPGEYVIDAFLRVRPDEVSPDLFAAMTNTVIRIVRR